MALAERANDKNLDNERALEAAADATKKERFLADERTHILKLAAKILNRQVTESDDEWSIAFIAASDAIDSYEAAKGDFWSFAAVVIKNRLYDYFRSEKRFGTNEIAVSPEAFTGDIKDRENAGGVELEVSKQASEAVVDSELREEIRALREELKPFQIRFRDLAGSSPKTDKTREGCGLAVAAVFLPPPLVEKLRRTKGLPAREIQKRTDVKKKLLERHRKHLVTAVLVFDGDYPSLREYFPYRVRSVV